MRDSVRHLSKGVAIYGAGDAAFQVVNVLMLAVYVKGGFLVASDYGALAVILSVEMIAKLVSRWGLDGAFMRYFHERAAGDPLATLASTIIWFTLGADIIVFAGALLASGWLGASLLRLSDPAHLQAFRLMLVNTFFLSVTYVPFHLMRLRNESVAYSGLVFARSAATVLARILFVIGMGWGLTGWYAADLAVTLMLLPVLWRWVRPLVRSVFSADDLRTVLRFGLPRLPHGLAQQALDAGNKLLLDKFVPRVELGIYQNGFTLGTAIRFFTSAFETAWAPFYYSASRKDDGRAILGKMTTYGAAVLTLLVAVTIAVAREVILVMLKPEYLEAARVIPFVAVGMAFQGAYLLTSIGLNLTTKTQYYPVATFAALAVGLGSGAILMPALGMRGAAIAFMLSAFSQTSVAFFFARRFYPIRYEVGRLTRIVVAGVLATAAGLWLVPNLSPLAGLVARSAVTAGVFAALLAATGFMRKTERAFVAEMVAGLRRRR